MKKITLIFTLSLILFAACKKSDEPTEIKTESKRVVLAYLFGDVNLWAQILESVNQMERNAPSKEDGTLLVYLDFSPSVTQFRAPVLLEITHDTTKIIASRVVKSYPQNQDAGNPEVFASILKQVTEEFPASSYGLIMGGHGNGWIVEKEAQHKSIGNSDRLGKPGLDIDKLAAAIPPTLHFDFIAFHACLMAEAATLYELRNKCDYVVASVETLPGYAFPYHKATKYLFTQPYADLNNFVATTTDYYEKDVNKKMFAYYTLGIYEMANMEQLAIATKEYMDSSPYSYDDLRDIFWKAIGNNTYDSLMMYPAPKLIPRNYNPQPFYDFYLLRQQISTSELYAKLYKAINNVVRTKHACLGDPTFTERATFNRYIENTCGISLYLPNKKVSSESDNAFYERFGWAKAAGFKRDYDRN